MTIAATLAAFLLTIMIPMGAFGSNTFVAGQYEGLMLGVDAAGNVTGYYEETQGEGVTKRCSFFLAGRAKSDVVEITTWSNNAFPGVLTAVKDGVDLKIPQGREHSGCGLVLLPQISDGIVLDRIAAKKWSEVRKILPPRAPLYGAPGKNKKSFLRKGTVVGVISVTGSWLLVEQPSPKEPSKGWVRTDDTKKLEPPP